MSTTPAPGPTQDAALADPVVAVRVVPGTSRRWGAATVALGVVTFVSGAFLIVMFVSLANGGSAAPWGPINDTLSAIGNLALAVLVPFLSRGAARKPPARTFVGLVTAGCVAAAAAGLLLVGGVLPFEQSTAVSMVVIVVQCAWMIWLNRAWSREGRMPRRIIRLGTAVGVGLLAGIGLVGASLLLPWGSAAANALLIPGVAVGGAMWILWPVWFILLGRHLSRAA